MNYERMRALNPNKMLEKGERYARAGNQKNAFLWYKQAAKRCSPEACFLMGEAYFLGKYVKQDYRQALQYYKLAGKYLGSEKQDGPIMADILYRLSVCYFYGYGVTPNNLQALAYEDDAEAFIVYTRSDPRKYEWQCRRIFYLGLKIRRAYEREIMDKDSEDL